MSSPSLTTISSMIAATQHDVAQLRSLLPQASPAQADIIADMLRMNHELDDTLHHIVQLLEPKAD